MGRRWAATLCILALVGGCGDGDGSGAGGVVTVTPPTATATVPGAPTIGAATAGDGSASIGFTAPSSNGGSVIIGYTATCTAASGTKTGTATASPITVAGLTNGTAYSCSVTATNSVGTSAASGAVSVTPVAGTTTTTGSVDPTRLPIGDNYVSTTGAAVNYVYMCGGADPNGGGASSKGPWFNSDGKTWNSLTKLVVSGVVSWASSFMTSIAGSTLNVSGNGLPSHPTGTFPIPQSDPVHQYDGNPNSISAKTIAWGLPATPTYNATPRCLTGGTIGVLLTGVRLFAPTDAALRDANAWEAQDSCQGHPQSQGTYHYHSISSCLQSNAETKDTPGQHSPLVGYAADGFGIYGNLGEGGKALTNADLDVCHGHSHAISVNGQTVTQYHYHKTLEFPYALGCFRGTPATIQ